MDKHLNTLYHYTTTEALTNIICSKENNFVIWASHAEFMNDPNEYTLGLKIMKDSLELFERKKGISKDKAKSSYIDLEKGVLSKSSKSFGEPFVFSLSEKKDDLTMWKAYGDKGNGIAIGIDFKLLGLFTSSEKSCWIKKCLYDYDKSCEQLSKYWENHYDDFTISEDGNTINIWNSRGFNPDISITDWSYILKTKHYADEQEWRLVKNSHSRNEWKFRVSNGLIVPYIELFIPVNYINELIIGPCKEPGLTRKGLTLLLKKIDRVDLLKSLIDSEVPFRTL